MLLHKMYLFAKKGSSPIHIIHEACVRTTLVNLEDVSIVVDLDVEEDIEDSLSSPSRLQTQLSIYIHQALSYCVLTSNYHLS